MNRNDVDTFEKLSVQLLGVYEEISLLSKKSPNDALNKFKLKFINKLLNQSNSFLTDKYKPFDDFELFEEEDMPQNSDEPPRDCRRLNILREYDNEKTNLHS